MNFPVWELEMGGGLLIAIVAILHVYVSHFAIGGGLFLVITEHWMYRHDDKHLKSYLVMHSKFFALVTLVFGAITGVGIWFTIGLVSPAATSSLIHTYVWGWAIEWVFFLVEIASAIIYYRTWDRISRKAHLAIGWIYFIAAFMSLVVINGIITFMLTPGTWLQSHHFWEGFFNPTYWPSLVTRTAICIGLAGLWALLSGTLLKHKTTKTRVVRYAAIWAFAGAALAIPSMYWYHSLLPANATDLLAGGMPAAAFAARILVWVGPALAIVLLAPIIFPKNFGFGSALSLALVGLLAFGSSEWVREALRKPYVIYDYMYGNGWTVDEQKAYTEAGGLLANAKWVRHHEDDTTAAVGEDVFRIACRSCHTVDGYNGLKKRLRGLDEQFVYELTGRLEFIRGQMPPFAGNDVERRALAKYLVSISDPDFPLIDGEEVFNKRCGTCHTIDGFRPLEPSLEGNTDQDIIDLLPVLGEMADGMAPWTGTDEEAQMLAEFIQSWYAAPAATEGGN